MAAQSSATLQQQVSSSLSSSLTSSPYAPSSHHLEHTLLTTPPPSSSGPPGGIPTLESSIYSLTPDLASLPTPGTDIESTGASQKITLLTRSHPANPGPPQPALSSSPLGSHFDNNVLSRMLLPSADTSPLTRQQQRDYYFDTEDPSVNLHDFIINSLQAPKNRVILLQLEDEFLKYVSDPKRTEPLKLPSWDSYHRMLAHRVAAYFGLEHNVDPQDKTRVVVLKGPSTRLPQQRFSDHIPAAVYEESDNISEPKLILKRIRASSGSEKFDGLSNNAAAEIKTFEEREEEYEKARARIFSQSSSQLHESDTTSIPFDLFSTSPFSQSHSTLRTPLHHRRTFSDTAFINKLFSQKENKPGPSSSGNSPSSTPAFFPPSPPSLSASSSSNVINQSSTTPDVETQLASRQHQKRVVASRPQPPTFMPLNSMQGGPLPTATIPIMYHPQAVIDPSWYYNHMVLYPVAAPAAPGPPPPPQAAGYPMPHVVQSPVLPHYSLPGQHPGVPGVGPRIGAVGIRVPSPSGISDHLGSPTHPGGIIYRPLPQQAPGVQLKSEEYSNAGPLWSPQGIPVYQTPHLPPSSSSQFPLPPPANIIGPGQLTEQMEKGMSLSDGVDMNDSSGDKVPPIGQQRQPLYMHTPSHVYGRGGGAQQMYGYPGMDPLVISPTALVPPTQSQFHPLHGHSDTIPSRQHHPSFPPTNLSIHGGDSGSPTLPPGITAQFQPPMQSPVQILGHTLSTSIFSPPPSAGPSGLFMTPPGSTASVIPGGAGGKPNSPGHSAVVGSGAMRFTPKGGARPPELPIQAQPTSIETSKSNDVTGVPPGILSQQQPLPPRLAQRGGGGTRYQNQRHPSNRANMKGGPADSPSVQYHHGQYAVPNNTHHHHNPYSTGAPRKEPLLPTPSEMIKLDTGITAGVPVHIMEVLNPFPEDSSENQQLISRLQEHGALEFKRSWMNRNTEVMIAIFDSSDSALQALKQCVLPSPAKLSIPLPTHAKHILQLLIKF
ncbi:PREDICTED: cAMP-regulated phosphoprotein 21-like [Amphimedon queenslandica]|uniref:R3H domain-containing protein n=1 Tax=Amphimedon queenslandica TaxID=400682 RepID=A0A1X7V8Y0_AMPQE|nr:PREDICTED: cAMP-regulated phosphoprotein 21-like [Amphimedon queenslandica]|eukprot:XP_003385249.2 PREDICTED: cAMP-regulated phosphoprotein 21-like [Amphimedon queenslandica]